MSRDLAKEREIYIPSSISVKYLTVEINKGSSATPSSSFICHFLLASHPPSPIFRFPGDDE